jgi:predicted kinase
MTQPLLCHFLIGTPASGKSTFGQHLAELIPGAIIVSTDTIRAQLYKDETIQGNWQDIEAEATCAIETAIGAGKSVIYDATNCKRVNRMDLLLKLKNLEAQWLAWQMETPVDICQQWNRQRSRQVPEGVITAMAQSLNRFPPEAAEGFIAVKKVKWQDGKLNLDNTEKTIENISRSQINRSNRLSNYQLHQYSRLLDFDRLLHLISLILRYPGVGSLQHTAPQVLKEILKEVPVFTTAVEEVSALMNRLYGSIYADKAALERDLQWLEVNEILSSQLTSTTTELTLTFVDELNLVPHPYSEIDAFTRLLKTIRFILYHPLLLDRELGSLETLVEKMQMQGIVYGDCRDSIRKDIEIILKPYQLLPDRPMTKGYFAGTSIFSTYELETLFDKLILPNLNSIEDPIYLGVYQNLKDKIADSKIIDVSAKTYLVRSMKLKNIVNANKIAESTFISAKALYKNLEALENAIATGQLLKLSTVIGSGSFPDEVAETFEAYPLQLVFHNIGWYLGLEYFGGKQNGLLTFKRLDRLCLEEAYPQNQNHSRDRQLKSLQRLTKLYEASPSLFIGSSVEEQNKFLNPKERSQVEMKVELWFSDRVFPFIAEGTQRFTYSNMKMSPPLRGTAYQETFKGLFSLKPSKDPKFPNKFQVTLPKWSLNDVDLKRWILGFDGEVKVVEPLELVEKIKVAAMAIICNYYFSTERDRS